METSESERQAPSTTAKTAAVRTREPSTRVRAVVNYDEKRHLVAADLDDDIRHGVAHPTVTTTTTTTTTTTGGAETTTPTTDELEEHLDDLEDPWDAESLFEDALEDLIEDRFFTDDPEACTEDESVRFRQMLRALGPEEFCRRTVDAGLITAKKLLTAFGIRPPAFLDGEPDDAYFGLLSLALSRELSKRAKLLKYNTVDDAVALLQSCRHIVVLTGAGISTSLGIPDFRSKGTGLYAKLEHLGLDDPQEVFDIRVFRDDPTIFYSIARDILPATDRYSPTHAFIALLQEKGKLLTNYSQNIDNLEAKAGIRPDKLVQCHGSFATASCVQCRYQVPGESIFPDIRAGTVPRCPRCAAAAAQARQQQQQQQQAAASRRKRKIARDGTENRPRRRRPGGDPDSNSDSEFDAPSSSLAAADKIVAGGVMKPDITFFGESLPDAFSERLTRHDRHRVDLVVVIGTSLRVAPVSEVVPFLPPNVPQLYISRTPVGHVNFDIDLLGDCDVVVAELCRRAGWDLRHEMIPEGQVVKVRTVEGYPSRHVFTQVEPPVEGEKPGKKSEGGGGGGGSGGGENGEGEKKKHRDSKDADDEEAEKKEG